MGKKEFATAVLNLKYKTYVVHVKSVSSIISHSFFPLDIHLFRRSQMAGLIVKKALTKISDEYVDFADVFSPDLVSELPKHTQNNDYTIQLVNGQKPFYKSIYSLELVKLETLKAHIKTNLANGFIKPSKSPTEIPFLFNRKSGGFL